MIFGRQKNGIDCWSISYHHKKIVIPCLFLYFQQEEIVVICRWFVVEPVPKMNWSASEGTTGGGKSRPSRTHSAAVNDWLGRTSSVGLGSSRATASYATDGLAGQAGHSARLVLTLTGWRRRALFGLLLTLTVIVIINLSLTLWLLRSMQFSLVRQHFFVWYHILD